MFCFSYSRQTPVLVFLIFATNFSTQTSHRAVSYKKTCSTNLVCFIGECPGSVKYLLHQPWEKWTQGENTCTKAVFVAAFGMLSGTDSDSNGETFSSKFDKLLTFSLFYKFIKARKQYIYNNKIP